VFGVSVTEIAAIVLVALIVVGPHKLPRMLRSLGEFIRKLRLFTTQMRAQTGIDEILREEGFEGGVAELRSLLRGDLRKLGRTPGGTPPDGTDPYPVAAAVDHYREYPPEGIDAGGALADDLVDEDALQRLEAEAPRDRELLG